MIKENILLKLSYADSFTILNGVFGLLSIFFILQGNSHAAFIFILLAVLADGMDGIMARKYGGFLGRYMDEFSDIVSFCVAPCIFAYRLYEIGFNVIFFASSSIFLIFGMLHLINYHISKQDFFVGLTTPAAAIIVMSLAFLDFPLWTIIVAFIVLAILMISPLPYPRIERHFAVIACVIIFSAMSGIKEFVLLLLIATILYTIFGPVYMKIKSSRVSL
jgi:CDP-diacylglycerol--serine O-phosphatidyltransferase